MIDTARAAVSLGIACAALAALPGRAAGDIDRGRYLVDSVMACGNCHTAKDSEARPIRSRHLAGGGVTWDVPPFGGAAPNITPDRETGIGRWSDEEIRRALVEGERPAHGRLAGVPLGAPMPVNLYRALTRADQDAIVAYLRSVPAVRNEVAVPTRRTPVKRAPYPDAQRAYGAADLRDPVRRGAYLAALAHCMECHTPSSPQGSLYGTAMGLGGKAFAPPAITGFPEWWKGAVSRNITPHPELGIGRWNDAEVKRAIREGVSRDGRTLSPPMPFENYAEMTEADLDALVAWLRSLPPRP